MSEATIKVRVPEGYECLGYGPVCKGEYYLGTNGQVSYSSYMDTDYYAIRLTKIDPLKGFVEALATLIRTTEQCHLVCDKALSVLNLVKFVRDASKLSPEAYAALGKLSLLETKQLARLSQRTIYADCRRN